MSIEYTGIPNPSLSNEAVEAIIDQLNRVTDISIVRKTINEVGFAFKANSNIELEAGTVIISSDNIYVGFHAGHRDQRDSLLRFLQSAITDQGSECNFEED